MRAVGNGPTANSVRFRVEPRLVPACKAARRLHLTLAAFEAMLPALVNCGFPSPCPVIGHFDLKAIEVWLDRVAGLPTYPAASEPDVDRRVIERIAALG